MKVTMASLPIPLYSEERYLALERMAAYKSEYHAGQIFAMAGGSPRHSAITARLIGEMLQAAGSGGCQVYDSNLRIHIPNTVSYVYPDVSVICGEPRYTRSATDVIDNPILVAEVLSPSTKTYDEGSKFDKYKTLDTLREYLIVSQTEALIELHSRRSNGDWTPRAARGRDAVLRIESLGWEIRLSRVYVGVTFDAV